MRLIFRYFIYSRKCYHHSRFLDWGGRSPRALDPLLTLALYFRLRSSWRFKSQGPGLAKRFINPFITFAFHRGLKIRINRPRNRTTFTRSTIRHIYFGQCTHVWRIRSHDQNRSFYGGWLMKLHSGEFSRRKKVQRGIRNTLYLFQCVTPGI